MAFCVKCGTEHVQDANFCGSCGAPLGQLRPKPKKAPPAATVTFCPHCGSEVSPMPKSKRKCPSCREVIVPRTLVDGTKALLTPDQATDLDHEKADLAEERLLVGRLEGYGVTDRERRQIEADLLRQWGSPPSRRDVAWTAGKHKATEAMGRNDFRALSSIYSHQAAQLHDEGADPFRLRHEAMRCELIAMQQANRLMDGLFKLRVLGICPESRAIEGRLYTIEEALEKMPIPRPDCSWNRKPGGYGICICSYTQTIDE